MMTFRLDETHLVDLGFQFTNSLIHILQAADSAQGEAVLSLSDQVTYANLHHLPETRLVVRATLYTYRCRR